MLKFRNVSSAASLLVCVKLGTYIIVCRIKALLVFEAKGFLRLLVSWDRAKAQVDERRLLWNIGDQISPKRDGRKTVVVNEV